ncbi:MAG: TetR/AcrR family transcriptional regulator [Acidimicrobiales bacterium]
MDQNDTSIPQHSVKQRAPASWESTVSEHRNRQRERILDAVLELLREHGAANVTMSRLAGRAGLSRPTLYHYFPDIDAVLTAWVGREVERSVTAMMAEAVSIEDPLARVAHLVHVQVEAFASQQHRLSVEHFEAETGSPALRQEVTEQMDPLRQLLAETISQAQQLGLVHPRVDATFGAELLLGMLGAARRQIVAGRLQPDAAEAAILELLAAGWLAGYAAQQRGVGPVWGRHGLADVHHVPPAPPG